MIIYVDGPAHLYLGEHDCEATAYVAPTSAVELGITESGVQCSVNTLTHRISSDDCGGSEGNPAEMLIMGATGTIRGSLVKYNASAWGSVASGLYNVNPGVVKLPGTALFAGGYGFCLWVIGNNISYYFPKCELASNPREFNISTTERKTSFTITSYPVMASASACALYYTGAGVSGGYYPGCVGANTATQTVAQDGGTSS